MARIRSLLIGGAVGAAAAYFLDPELGAARRARLQGDVEERVRRLQDGARAAAARLQAPAAARPDDDLSLLSRVESALLALPGVRRGAVESEVVDGHVVLRGDVASDDQERQLVETAGGVHGVSGVESHLHVSG